MQYRDIQSAGIIVTLIFSISMYAVPADLSGMVAFQAIEMQEDDADETLMMQRALEAGIRMRNDNRTAFIEGLISAREGDFVAPDVLLNVCCCSVVMGAGIGHICSSSADHLTDTGFMAGVSNMSLGAFTGLVGASALLSLPSVNRVINRLLHSKTD